MNIGVVSLKGERNSRYTLGDFSAVQLKIWGVVFPNIV